MCKERCLVTWNNVNRGEQKEPVPSIVFFSPLFLFVQILKGSVPRENMPELQLTESIMDPQQAPRLEGGRFSESSIDFVARCVQPDLQERASLQELCRHPFIASSFSRERALLTQVQKALKIKVKGSKSVVVRPCFTFSLSFQRRNSVRKKNPNEDVLWLRLKERSLHQHQPKRNKNNVFTIRNHFVTFLLAQSLPTPFLQKFATALPCLPHWHQQQRQPMSFQLQAHQVLACCSKHELRLSALSPICRAFRHRLICEKNEDNIERKQRERAYNEAQEVAVEEKPFRQQGGSKQ